MMDSVYNHKEEINIEHLLRGVSMKKCLKCKLDKDLTNYYQSKRNLDGYRKWCKKCCSDANKGRVKHNKSKILSERKHTPKGDVKNKDFSNTTINDWLILNKISDVVYLCQCKCGFQREHDIYYLRTNSKSNQSCRQCAYKRRNAHDKQQINIRFFTKCKHTAKKREIKFELTRNFLYDLFFNKQNQKCALTGLSLFIPDNTIDFEKGMCTASVDRIDSDLPYTINNVQIVHKDINIMKWALSQKDFIKYCHMVAKYNEETN